MYYIKNFLIYSLFGFIMESTLYKIKEINQYSGILYGPITVVYGFGITLMILLDKYFFKKIKCHKTLKLIIEFIILILVLSIIEGIGGYILDYIFDIEMWNYSHNHPHFGKYICFQNSIIWGILGLAFIHILKPFTDKIIHQITNKETYIFITILSIDIIITLITKI